MSGDNFTNGSKKTRPVLGDVTNLPGKRGFSSISGDGFAKNKDNESGNSTFDKKLCLQVENLVKEVIRKSKSEVDGSKKIESLLKNMQNVFSNAKEKGNKMPDLGVTIAHNAHGDALRDSFLSSVSVPMCSKKDSDGERVGLDTTEDDIDDEELLVSHVCNDKDVGAERLALSKFGSIEWSMLPKSQSSQSFELERCSGLKDDDCVNLNADADMLKDKDCCCSFCLKAAYIWADLHYQDIRGRIDALKKSQKDASLLAQKWGRERETDIHGHGNADKSSKLESALMSQWRSLFLHMEDVFGHESSQLQAGYVSLKDLRENCKMDLESTSGMPSGNH